MIHVSDLSAEVMAIANAGPVEANEMARALTSLGANGDDVKIAKLINDVRPLVSSTDEAIRQVRKRTGR